MMRWVVLLPFLWAGVLHAAEAPRLELAGEEDRQRWMLTGLPDLLTDTQVRKHLETGLTTSFVFRLSLRNARGEKVAGGARVEVRYELWEEVYEVASLGIDGTVERETIPSFGDLLGWWRNRRLVVFDRRQDDLSGSGNIRLQLDVVPFSQQERDDTQRWFSDSLENAGRRSSAEKLADSVDEPPEKLGRAFHLLMATSIQRHAIKSFQWQLERPIGVAS